MNLGSIWSNKPNLPPRRSINVPSIQNKVVRHVNQAATRSYWGTAVWFFFHTIAGRINSSFYASNYQYIWGFIKEVCNTLPCPFCQKHATEYVNKITSQQINTKEKLKTVLFEFHNSVNSRTGKSIVGRDVLTKYNRANIKPIFDLFEERFFHSYIGRRQFDDWIKNNFKQKFITFYNIVRTQFN